MTLIEQASLVLIPSGYAEDKVYSVIPSNGTGDMSFTRASNGTRINSDGLVENTPWNLLTYSEDLSNAIWALSSATISTNATTAPNGTLTADKFIGTATNAVHFFQQSAISSSYVFSIYAKAGEENVFSMWIANTSKRAEFNLTTGTIPLSTVANSSIVNVGNGWYRCSVYDSSPTTTYRIYGRTGSSYLGNGVDGMFFWGAQLNDGTTAKVYFPTTDRLNVPRLTYQNGGGGCPSLLLEPQRTNVLTYSQELNDLTWTKTNVTVTANTNISPDGTQNADLVNFDAISGARLEKIIAGAFENQTHTITVFAKVTSGTQQFRLKCTHGAVVDYFSSDFTATTTWQRFTFTQTFGASIGTSIVAGIINSTSATAKSILFYGIQLETNSSYATSYIPTVASSATRIVDTLTKTGISSLIGQTEGTLFTDFVCNGFKDYGTPLSVNNSSTSNNIWITTFANGNIRAELYNGAVQASITYTGGVIGQRYKLAFAYKTNDFAMYVNGSLVGTDVSGTTFSGTTLSRLDFDLGNPALYSLSLIQVNQAILFKNRLTNSELATLTTI